MEEWNDNFELILTEKITRKKNNKKNIIIILRSMYLANI